MEETSDDRCVAKPVRLPNARDCVDGQLYVLALRDFRLQVRECWRTSGAVAFLIVTGTFDQIAAIAATLWLLNYLSAYLAVFKLRRAEPLDFAAVSAPSHDFH